MFHLFVICSLLSQYDISESNITLNVPNGSIVNINNNLTTSIGIKREYKFCELNKNYYYEYNILVQYNGQEKFSKILLVGGQNKQITFSFYELKIKQDTINIDQPPAKKIDQPLVKKIEKPIKRKFPVYVPD